MLQKKQFFSILLFWLMMAQQCFAYTYNVPISLSISKSEALDAADILGIRKQVDRLLALREPGSTLQSEEALTLNALILRKVLCAVLEVRQACNKVDLELAYAYDIMRKQERREQFIFQLFNLANFAQISTFYTLEPWVRIHKQFVMSAIFTTTSGSLGTTIATMSKLYGHMAKASNVAPPEVLADIIDGKPVDATGFPPLVTKFLNSREPDSKLTRKEEIFAMWKKRYHIDASNQKNLCGINDKKKASLSYLSSRVLLLWSLHTYVQDFDRELLCLVKLIKAPEASTTPETKVMKGFASYESEAMHLLHIEPQVQELISLKEKNIYNKRRDELELLVLEKTLEGVLEIQVASDKVDEELNYNYHVILSDLINSRAKWMQWTYNLNFLQSGIMGIIAGRLYLSRFSYAGDRQFVISGSIGTGLTTLSILEMHGFWRKVDTPPNSLAEVMNLHPVKKYRFSSFVSSFLNTPAPGSTNGKTRREQLNDMWKQTEATTMNLNQHKNLVALSNMPPHKYDTIKIATNRNILLHSLKKELEFFQIDCLKLLQITD